MDALAEQVGEKPHIFTNVWHFVVTTLGEACAKELLRECMSTRQLAGRLEIDPQGRMLCFTEAGKAIVPTNVSNGSNVDENCLLTVIRTHRANVQWRVVHLEKNEGWTCVSRKSERLIHSYPKKMRHKQ